MAFPPGLKFKGRRAEDEHGAYFDCVRSGHPPGKRRVRRGPFKRQRDREQYITRHDALYHDELLAAKLGIVRSPTLGDAVGDFLQHIRNLVARGKRDTKTHTYYKGICDKLIEHFGSETFIDTIQRQAILDYAEKERKRGSTSGGDRFIKAAKVVKRIQKFKGANSSWEIPTDDISPTRRERVPIEIGDIRDFLRAMEVGSLEYVFSMTKFITMLRNEELYAADTKDVTFMTDDDGRLCGELEYYLRNKQTGTKKRYVTYIPPALAILLLEWIGDRRPHTPLFHIEGRRIDAFSLRKRFLSASKRATNKRREIDHDAHEVKITAIGQFRHEASTMAREELESVYSISKQLGHTNEQTFQKHYELTKRTTVLKESKRVTESAASKLDMT